MNTLRKLAATMLLLVAAQAVFGRSIKVEDASASLQGDASVAVSYSASDALAVGAEIRIDLPEGINYVAGSAAMTSDRTAGQQMSAAQVGRQLVIILFNVSHTPIAAGDGEILSFRLRSGKEPGRYSLAPQVKLSDSSGKALATEAVAGTFTVVAPKLSLSASSVDFGRVPIRSSYTKSITVTNSGTAELNVSGMMAKDNEEFSFEPSAFTLQSGASQQVAVKYSPLNYSDGIEVPVEIVSDASNSTQSFTLKAVPYSVNELKVLQAEGVGGTEVTVAVTMNNMEPIAGVDAVFNLPEQLQYVEGSVECTSRSTALSARASVSGRKLRIILYSMSNAAIDEGDGDIFTFRLKLAGSSGYYTLQPTDVKLANAAGRNMLSGTGSAYVVIQSPRIDGGTILDFGQVPATEPNEVPYTINNNGQAPLTVDKVTFLAEGFEVASELPMTIARYQSGQLKVRVLPRDLGSFATTMNIYSNDPVTPMKTVAIKGNAYSPNELIFSGVPDDSYTSYTITGSLTNAAPIVALQLDVRCDPSLTTSQAQLKLSERASGHSASIASIGEGLYRLVIFSLSNKEFSGNDGPLFALTFTGSDIVGKDICFENVKLSNASGQNFTTPGSEMRVGKVEAVDVDRVEISAESLTLKAGETSSLSASTFPSNAFDKSLSWTSSSNAVSVDKNGHVTANAVGTATVRATAASGVYAECVITVESTAAENVVLNFSEATLKVGQTLDLTATVLPETTTDKSVIWTSNSEAVSVDENGHVTAIAVGTATVRATAASGVYAECVITVEPTAAESVVLNFSEATLKVGQTLDLTATVLPETTTDKTITWSTESDIITIDQNGKVTAFALGTATVRATAASGVYAECIVTVEPTAAENVVLNFSEATLKVGQTLDLTASVLPETTTDKSVIWTSNSEAVSVDEKGKVIANAVGTATVRATADSGVYAECVITVESTAAESVVLSITHNVLKVGNTFKIIATVLPETTTNKSVTWTSSDENVALVDDAGNVTAVGIGSAVVRATAASGVYAECTIYVGETAAESIELNYTDYSMKVGETVELVAKVLPETTTDKTVQWKSSSQMYASVDDNGKVTAVRVGTAYIRAWTSNGLEAECKITVEETPVESVVLDHTELTLKVGQQSKLTATLLPENATRKRIIWSSSSPENVWVSSDGDIYAYALGTAVVRATAANGVYAECIVTVEPTAAESVELNFSEATIKVGQTLGLSATVLPDNTTDKTVTWSTESDIITVDQNGKVTALAVGTAIVRATATNGVYAECVITVEPTVAESVELNFNKITLNVGQTADLYATVLPETTTDKTVTWSTESDIITVDQNGKVTALAVGTATVRATAVNGVYAECIVTVEPIAVLSVVLNYSKASLIIGQTIELIATVYPENATDKTVVWTSDSEAVSVDENGRVTANAVGTAKVRATAANGVYAECVITVEPTLVESLKLDVSELELVEGDTYQLIATLLPENADNIAVEWSSDDESVARVSEGLIEAIAEGVTIVRVRTTDGSNREAQCLVTVKKPEGLTDIIVNPDEQCEVYDLSGRLLRRDTASRALKYLKPGAYIIKTRGKTFKYVVC